MNKYVFIVEQKEYIIEVEKYKDILCIYINNRKIFDIKFPDSISIMKSFYTIDIKGVKVIISLEYFIPKGDFRVSYKTDCYLNGKSLLNNESIDSLKQELTEKTQKGFKHYFVENWKSIIKETVTEMVVGSVIGWGVAGFIIHGIKKQLLAILVTPFFSILLGALLIVVSYYEDKKVLKNWDKQYIETVYIKN